MFLGFYIYGWQLVIVSANSNNSSKVGVFSLNVNNTWTNDNVNISSHLCLFIFFCTIYRNLATGQNTKQSLIQFGRLILEELEVK